MTAVPVPNSTSIDPVRLIQTHQSGVWRYLRLLGCEPHLAEDLTQETFLAVLQHPFQELSQAATASYLRKTAHNLLVSHHRRAGRVVVVEDVETLDRTWTRWIGEDNGEELLETLRECLRKLNERAQLALELRYRDQYTRADIAGRLKLTEDGAKNLLQRAKQALRDCITAKMK